MHYPDMLFVFRELVYVHLQEYTLLLCARRTKSSRINMEYLMGWFGQRIVIWKRVEMLMNIAKLKNYLRESIFIPSLFAYRGVDMKY